MKIKLEIPDWAVNGRLVILSGTELVASKEPEANHWLVKDVRCNLCGECCLDSPNTPFGLDNEGKCVKLVFDREKYWCMAKSHRPYNCCIDPIEAEKENLGCCITYKKIKA